MADVCITHHGIKGMKWGVRRYQNKDGSLTSLGKRKYTDKEISEYRKRKISEAPTKAESPRGANKGWYRNAPKTTLIREMRREESEVLKAQKKINTKKDSFVLKKEPSYIVCLQLTMRHIVDTHSPRSNQVIPDDI